MTGDTVTILRHSTLRLAKLVRQDGSIAGYDTARQFDLATHPVADLNAVARLLHKLVQRPDLCIVRGEIADDANAKGVRRLLHRDPETGDSPTLRDVSRLWLALDMEDIPRPVYVPVTDLAGCYRAALQYLPDTFGAAACIVQASGSHGFKPDIRLRLWFWCSRPMGGTELKRWLRDTPADPAIFGAAQPIYTAAPVLADGVVDPVPQRLVMVPGGALAVPTIEELAPPPRPTTPPTPINPARVGRYVRAALEHAAGRIMTASKRHPTIIGECRSLSRLVLAGSLPESDLRAVVHAAAAHAGKTDPSEIDRSIAWGLANPTQTSAGENAHV